MQKKHFPILFTLSLMFISMIGLAQTAYITNSGDSSVTVIFVPTNTVIDTIKVGGGPFGVSVSPDGSKVYVTNSYDGTVSLINTATNTVSDTITVGVYPSGLSLSPDGSKVYVTNGDGTISIINTATNTVSEIITVGGSPSGVSVSPNGSKVYVANFLDNTVSVINTTTNTVSDTIKVGARPQGVSVSPDGSKVYVTNIDDSTVSVINTTTNTVSDIIKVGIYPSGISVSPDGSKVYVTNNGDGTVSVIHTATNIVSDTIKVGANPFGISVSPDGSKVYVTNYGYGTVRVINTSTNTVSATIAFCNYSAAFGNFISIYTPSPVAKFQSSDSIICVGDCINFTDLNLVATSWQWNFSGASSDTSSIPNPVNICYNTEGQYSVKLRVANNAGIDSIMLNKFITVNPTPTPSITASGATTFCQGDSITLSANTANSYLWSNGATTQSTIVNATGIDSVTISNTYNCNATASININELPPSDSTLICMVTVDSLSKNNIIIWSKTHPSPLDSFIVYREIATNNYQPIGAVQDVGALSEFTDTVHTKYFPNTGDPNAGTYRYKLQIRDTCGNYTGLSPYHNTIFVIDNNNGTFSWAQLYTIEGDSNPVNSYNLMRDDSSDGNWHVINSVSGNQYTIADPAYNSFKNTASWRVQTEWGITCTPTMRVNSTSTFSTSLSNITGKYISGISELANSDLISIYPNPANNQLTIHISLLFSNEALTISVMNVLGEMMQEEKTQWSSDASINIKSLSAGIYFLQIESDSGMFVKRFVKE